MRILFGFLWGILTPVIMAFTNKYWIPALYRKQEEAASETDETGDGLGHALPQTYPLRDEPLRLPVLILSGIFAFACGYFASSYISANARWFVSLWLAFCVLACIAVTDCKLLLMPNKCSLALLAGGCLLLVWEWIDSGSFPSGYALQSIISLVVSLVMLLLISFVSRGGVGMGDVKIVSCLAFVCGLRAVCYLLIFALLFSAVFSVVLLLTKKKQLKDLLPLGPFMWIAAGLLILLNFI